MSAIPSPTAVENLALDDATANPHMVTQPGRPIATAVVACILIVIGFATLRPEQGSPVLPTYCVVCGSLGGLDFVMNTLLFVPLGLGARWLTGTWRRAVLVGIATTILVEALQWQLIRGRHASLGDLIANTLGTMAGAWLAIEGVRWLNATGDSARRLSAAFGIIVSSITIGAALILLPVQPRGAQFVQWTPVRPNMDPFPGRLLSAELNEKALYPTLILPPEWMRDSTTNVVTVKARVTAPERATTRQAIVLRMANTVEEGFMLAQRGERVVFRTHVNASRLRLRPLLIGVDGGLPVATPTGSDSAAGVIMLEATSNPRAMAVRAEQPAGGREVTLRRTIGLGWSLLVPWDVALNPSWWPVNAAWLGVLVFPVSFLAMRTGHTDRGGVRPPVHRWWPSGLVLAALVAGPAAVGLSPIGLGEWLGVAAGVAAGWSLERWTLPAHLTNFNGGATPS